MKLNKGDQILDIKTGNSQLSDIDLFSKLEASFLEKFFKYNLTDYFPQIFTNVFEDIFDRKTTSKLQKNMCSSLFFANSKFTLTQLQNKIDDFYKLRSKSISQSQLPFAFRKRYCHSQSFESTIQQGEIMFFDVKIKAEVQKIQEIPEKILRLFQSFKVNSKQNLSQLQNIFANYKGQYFNIFFIYFGDINFNLFNKKLYQIQSIKIFGNTYKLKIFVFFVSKQGLIECFRTVNKIQNLQYINDLVIQFYQLKREKQRRKRNKPNKISKIQELVHEKQKIPLNLVALGVVGVVGLITFGVAIKKLYF